MIYKNALIEEMIKQNATEKEISLITDEVIENAIKQNKKVEDVAWALLQ